MSGDAQHDPHAAARLAELLELTQDAVFVREFRTKAIGFWNRGAERLYGWSRDDAVGRVAHELLHTKFPESLEAVDAALLSVGFWEGELEHQRRDGSHIFVFSRHAIQRGADGTPSAILEINTDITAHKEAGDERVRRLAEQRARELAERALDRLSRLHRVRSALAETLTPEHITALVLTEAVGSVGAAGGSVSLEGEVLAAAGTDVAAGAESHVVPLVVDSRQIGAMTLYFSAPRALDPDDLDLLTAFANQCAQGVERARLHGIAQQAQEDLRRSRDQLAAILGGIAEGVTVQDAHGALVYVNDVAAQMSGFQSADELLAAPVTEVLARYALFDEVGNPLPLEQLPGRRLLQGLPAGEIAVRFRDVRTGEVRWSILDATPVLDDQGGLLLVVNIFRDITDRKRQSDAVAFLAEASTVLGASLDAEATLSQLAQLAVRGLADMCIIDLVDERGSARRLATAHGAWEHVDLPHSPPHIADFEATVERVARGSRAELIQNDGSAILAPMRTRGLTLGVITLANLAPGRRYGPADLDVVEDLATRSALALDNARLFQEAQEQAEHQSLLNTAMRETIDERDRAMADLQQALRTRDEFLASASHDLKNPLASIKATAQLMQRRIDRTGAQEIDRVRQGLQRLDAIATRAAELVEELLDLARMQMGRPLDLDRGPTDLVALARDAVTEQQQTTERHQLSVDTDLPALTGLVDANRVRRVLGNLIDNAIKYSPQGGAITIRVAHGAEDSAELEVEDHGLGIPARDIARIFERFQRASNVEGRIAGTGIGLASARHIVGSHGGTIDVTSREGSGTTIRVHLPLQTRHAEGGK
jgi:PAS domain S-box-containing protein